MTHATQPEMVCLACHTRFIVPRGKPGLALIVMLSSIALALFGLVLLVIFFPLTFVCWGLMYALWAWSKKIGQLEPECPACNARQFVPANTPAGQQIINGEAATEPNPIQLAAADSAHDEPFRPIQN